MRERVEVAYLGDQADRGHGQRVDAAQAAQPTDQRGPSLVLGLAGDQAVEALAACEQHLVAGQVLPEHDPGQRIAEIEA